MSAKVKQANFRLPLAYMDMIDEFAKKADITKAAVITRALDCMKASYDSGNNGMPITASASSAPSASDEEIEELKNRVARAEARLEDAVRDKEALEKRLATVEQARDAAEARANDAIRERDAAEQRLRDTGAAGGNERELRRLRDLVAKQEKQLSSRNAENITEIAEKNAAIAERDEKIAMLSEQLGAANAKAELALKNINVEAVTLSDQVVAEDDPNRALAMLNMIGGVMNAFQKQVDDARAVGEQEGREAVRKELQDMVQKARNDGYRDAMGYLDDRVTTARDSGAREERARIANMTFFERRRYLRMHIA